MKRRISSVLLAVALIGGFLSIASSAASADDNPGLTSSGQDFWLAFDANENGADEYLRLFIAGDPGTSGTVTISGLSFDSDFTIGDQGVASVDVPMDARGAVDYPERVSAPDTPGYIAPIAIHIVADHDVNVYGLNRAQYTTDAFLGLPTSSVGTRYRLVDYNSFRGGLMSVVATEDDTTISIVPDAATEVSPFTVTLSQGQVFEWEESSTETLTGTVVTSDKPVSVFAGNRCSDVPVDYSACNHVIEQMLPTNTWGRTFVTYPLRGRTADTFRVVADVDGTQVTVNKAGGAETHTLNAGEYWEFESGEPMEIASNQPIEVAQYSNSESYDNTNSDPFMVLVPPFEQGFTDSVFSTPVSGFTNYVNITAPTSGIADVLLDGAPIPTDQWVAIPGSDYSGVSVAIDAGIHRLSSPVPLQTIVYGDSDYDGYGYPGGMRTARIAEADTLTLAPTEVRGTTGAEICSVATLADASGVGIAGARLDVAVTGVVAQNFSVVTGDDGTVAVCATSTIQGTADVTVTQGDLSAQARFIWSDYVPTFSVSYDANSPDATGTVTDTASYHSGDAATVAANGFTRTGYSFASWNTSADGSGTSYLPGSSLTVTGHVTLYAQWKAVTIQVQTGGTASQR